MCVLGKVVLSVLIALTMAVPASLSLAQPASGAGASQATALPQPHTDLLSQSVSTPGYSNGNLAYLNNTTTPGVHSETAGCLPHAPFILVGYSSTKNFGLPALTTELFATAQCGVAPYSVHWVFGDGNQTTESVVNITAGGGLVQEFIFNHTYKYVGSFVALVSVTDTGRNSLTPLEESRPTA
jgi:hypothetical protein